MKRIIKCLLLIITIFFLNFNVNAKTIRELQQELLDYEAKYNEAKKKQNLTKDEINEVNARILKINQNIEKSEENIKELQQEIQELNEAAEKKEEEIKSVITFTQISDSGNVYLEYIFGSTSIEDLVLRAAVSEQLVGYNDDLIEDYNNTIGECEAKTEELNAAIENLNKEKENLNLELVKLGDQLKESVEVAVSADDVIKETKKKIDYYLNTMGCDIDQDVNKCGTVPFTGKFVRPVDYGSITSKYGYRIHPTKGTYQLHTGIDIGGGAETVYATGPGVVAGFIWKSSCGGTMIFIHHNLNGKYYTSVYMHLSQVFVSEGQYVDQNTKIAITGGTPSLTPWDTCTTGRHLHFQFSTGLYLKDYFDWATLTSRSTDPTALVNFPGYGVWFSGRK